MATNINVGSAYLTVIPSTRGFVKALEKQLGKDVRKSGKKAGQTWWRGFMDSQVLQKVRRSFHNLFQGLSRLGKYGVMDTLIMSALAAVSAIAPLAGLLVGLPAAALIAGGAIAGLALALDGFGTALGAALSGDAETFNGALDDMQSSARKVTKEIGAAFFDLKDIAQEAFFAPMVESAKGFGETLQGPIERGIKSVSAALGEMGAGVLDWAKSSEGAATIEKSFHLAADAIEEAGKGLPFLLQGLLDLANVAVGDVGKALRDLMTDFGTWMSAISADGRAVRWFNEAKEVAKDLISVGVNLWRVLVGIFSASGSDGGLLRTLIDATDAMADWVETAAGQDTLAHIFQFFGTVISEFLVALGQLVRVFAAVAEWFNTLSPETQGMIAKFLAWTMVGGLLYGRVMALVSAVKGLSVALFLLGRGVWTAIAALGKLVWSITLAIGAHIRLMITSMIAGARMAAASAAAAAAVVMQHLKMIGIYARTAAAAVMMGLRSAGVWAAMAARAVASVAVQVAQFAVLAAKWLWAGAQALIAGARMAAAWVLGMGPIGWIIAAIIGLAALIFAYWDEISAFLSAAWNWIKDTAVAVWSAISSFFADWWNEQVAIFQVGIALIKNFISSTWNSIKSTTSTIWNGIKSFFSNIWDAIKAVFQTQVDRVKTIIGGVKAVVQWFKDWFQNAKDGAVSKLVSLVSWAKGLPGRISSAVGAVKDLLLSKGKDVMNGLLNGMKNAAGAIRDWISGLMSDIANSVKDFFGIASPSKLMKYYGEMMGDGLEIGLKVSKDGINDAADLIARAANPADDITATSRANVNAVNAADTGPRVVNVYPQAADNRFSMDELTAQVRMAV